MTTMKSSRVVALMAACCVSTVIALPANVTGARASPRTAQADTPAQSGRALPQPAPSGGRTQRETDDSLGVTTLRAFVHDRPPTCLTLTGLFEFAQAGIALVYRRPSLVDFSQQHVRGQGDILTLEEDGCRIRLQVSFDGPDAPAIATAPQEEAPAGGRDAPLRSRFHQRLSGGGVPGEAIAILPVTAEKSPRVRCFAGTGLFTVTPNGFGILFHQRRSELPFNVEERVSLELRYVALAFYTPTCQMTLKVEQEARKGDEWVRLAPVE